MATANGFPEIGLSAAWHAGLLPDRLRTVDGRAIEVIHRGVWSHGLGPDFRDAMLLFDDRELRAGAIEVHIRTRGWIDHGHDHDGAYDAVILHVVARHDGTQTRRSDGAAVPVLELGEIDRRALPDLAFWRWDRVGGVVCAEEACRSGPAAMRAILERLGDVRLATRSARIEARFAAEPPGQVIWSELLNGFGFSANREPMRALAATAQLAAVEDVLMATSASERLAVARGLLLGVAGFLPLSPTDAHFGNLRPTDVAALEAAWRDRGVPWRPDAHSPSIWTRVRVRPANHPVPRLLAAASLLCAASYLGGLLPAILDLLQHEDEIIDRFRALTAHGERPSGIGSDRAIDILASGVLPFALALAAHAGDEGLAEAASAQWDRLPAPAANAVTRRALHQVAGSARLGKIGARGAQGLIHLDTTLCQPRRCFECPIAAATLAVTGDEISRS